MNLMLYLVVHTANILGIFTDPFEFEGDYGPDVNPVRQKVFELVVPKEALTRNLTDEQILERMQEANAKDQDISAYRKTLLIQAIVEDCQHGPVLSDLVTPELINELVEIQEMQSKSFSESDIQGISAFINKYGDQKVFRFLRNNPNELLSLDHALKNNASREGKNFDLPLLNSTELLKGKNSHDLKKNLLHAVFNEKTFSAAKSEEAIKKSLKKLDHDYLKQYFGNTADNQDLFVFSTPAGQTFFYWLFHALNLHLISEDPAFIGQVNDVKERFSNTLGNPEARANIFRDQLIAADSGVVFTQESDTYVPKVLLKEGLFLPVDRQNPKDGAFVFLRSDLWEPDYEIISIENYKGYTEGRLTVVLATQKESGEKFLLASGHGHSTNPEDGRQQISLVMNKFLQLSQEPQNAGLQLIIGIDANTKSEADVKALNEHLDAIGLIATSVGPTTVKMRMVTAQHSKAGRFAMDEEDFIITLKPESGGRFLLTKPTVGFSEEKSDINKMLPNIDNQSDHYPVGATLQAVSVE